MKSKKWWSIQLSLVTIIFLITIILSNCSYDDSIINSDGVQPINIKQKFPENFQLGGTLRLSSNNFFNSLDPHNDSNISDSSWGPGLIYDRMFQYKHGKNIYLPSLESECLLCTKWSLDSENNFTFTVPDNLTWNTNPPTPLTTSDIEFSINRIKNHQNHDFFHMIESIDTSTKNQISFQLRYSDSDFIMALTDTRNKIISKNLTINSDVFSINNSIGSNSWAIEKFIPNTKTTLLNLRKNDDQPFVDSIEINVLPDYQTRLSAYMVGLIDVYEIENFEHTLKNPPLYENKLDVLEPSTGISLAFNTSKFPFNNRYFRNAIVNSINLNEIQRHNQYFALGMPLINQKWQINQNEWNSKFNNPTQFSENLTLSEVEMPMTIKILTTENTQTDSQIMEILSKQLTSNGFTVETKILNNRDYAKKTWDQKDFDVSLGPQFPQISPNSFLFSIMHSQGKLNSTNTYNIKLDKLIEQQSQTYDSEDREKIIQEINSILFDEMYRFMIKPEISSWTWNNSLNNVFPNFYSQEYKHWDKIWIER